MANTLTAAITASQQGTGTQTNATSSANPADRLANKDTFLQLMVAQLRYQNPLSPVDGSSFLAQLSQISSVEQMVQMRQDLGQIRDLLAAASANSGSSTTIPKS
ncbi:MAG: hypothetical protein HY820_00155 [Acidobacteria bacterium]|nr:hypothetical protein [Acidobacteriota bacterium]